MLLKLTYMSDGWKVTGYLGIPASVPCHPEEIARHLRTFYGNADLDCTPVACWVGQGQTTNESAGQWPIFVYCRGGSGRFGAVRLHWIEAFASHGYIVFAPCYRGNEGGEGKDEFGGAEQEDVHSGIRFVRNLPFADPERVAVMGFSRGAINAARAACELEKVDGLVLWSGVADLAQTYAERPDLRRTLRKMIGHPPDKQPEAYRQRSPLYLADQIRCPVLLIHGSRDEQVPVTHADKMYAKLKAGGWAVEYHRYDEWGHLFPPQVHREATERMFRWLRQSSGFTNLPEVNRFPGLYVP